MKNDILYGKFKKKCTGCGACHNICPRNAITMIQNEYGFYQPQIDKEKCVNCGLCEKTCPIENYKSKNITEPKTFAFQNCDEKILYKCASGGAFACFAKYVIEQDGIVYGVIYDEEMKVCHSRTDNLNDLEKMYSSKYVQSDTKNTYKQAKEDLENGRLVLYSGTPCQIAGLKSFLKKEYENLITIDLVCHGAPSPLIFEKYKQEFMMNKPKERLLNINFRSKQAGWNIHYLTHYTTTTTTVRSYHIPGDYWVKIMNHAFNECCGNCQFNCLPRCGDITIGDFWGVDEYEPELNNNKGLSIILINNKKGEEFSFAGTNKCLFKEVPISAVIKRNPNVCQSSIADAQRNQFLNEVCIQNKSLLNCAKKYCKVPLHITLYRLLPRFAKDFIKYKILKMEKKN